MNTTIPQSIIIAFGVVMCATCAISIYSPSRLIRAVRTHWDNKWGIYSAVVVRVVLGALLILAAPDTKFPVVFKALGIFFIVGAIAIAFAGRKPISALMAWVERLSPLLIRFYLLFGIAFGVFLIYGTYPLR
jgi:uncharacterized membrane protein YfcA